ncbi:MAG: transcription antitermination factor NusB [Planctomycetes bacterium]|nr:transcription antitermination factor NusB [Planctomycetota bacterium]
MTGDGAPRKPATRRAPSRRSRAREIALRYLYRIDLLREDPGQEDRDAFLRGESADLEVAEYARLLIEGCIAERDRLDRAIASVVENWAFDRISVTDRNVLRIGSHELLSRPDVPPKVAIDEAVELGKRYGSKDSGAFINGILDRIWRLFREGEKPATDA